jgi:hypothetical protein
VSSTIVAALFSGDAESLAAWSPILDPRVHLRIGSRKPALGLVAALSELDTFLMAIRSFGRDYREIWELREATLVEIDVVGWPRGNAPAKAIPCAIIFRTGDGPLALDVRFYLDPGKLFEVDPERSNTTLK